MMVDFEFPKQGKTEGYLPLPESDLLKTDLEKLEDIQKLTFDEIKNTKKAMQYEEE